MEGEVGPPGPCLEALSVLGRGQGSGTGRGSRRGAARGVTGPHFMSAPPPGPSPHHQGNKLGAAKPRAKEGTAGVLRHRQPRAALGATDTRPQGHQCICTRGPSLLGKGRESNRRGQGELEDKQLHVCVPGTILGRERTLGKNKGNLNKMWTSVRNPASLLVHDVTNVRSSCKILITGETGCRGCGNSAPSSQFLC